MNNRILMASLYCAMCGSATLATPMAWAEDGQFSLSSGSGLSYGTASTADILSAPVIGKYETGPWVFKLTVPNAGAYGTSGVHIKAGSAANSTQSGLTDTVAAATYSIYSGDASAFGIDLTGKVKLGLADKFYGSNSGQNDYAAQADAYQSFDKFKALGSLGYKIQGDATGISMNRILYGSVGGAYQLNNQMSGGVDFSLSQSPAAVDQGQRQLSAYVSQSINKSFKAKGYILKDFSNSSADHSVGAAVSYGF